VTIPHTRPGTWPELRPGSFAQTIPRTSADDAQLALLGLPDDTGVRLNNGRPGAAEGPAAFRAALARAGTTYDLVRGREMRVRVFDAGDVVPASPDDHGGAPEQTLHATHDRVTDACAELHRLGLVPVCIGGGHDLTLPTVRALARHVGDPLGGLNVDGHLDVREGVGSGMPFRRLIEGGFLDARRFVEYGIARFANSREHVEWLTERGGSIVEISAVGGSEPVGADAMDVAFGRSDDEAGRIGFVSIDLDGIDSSQAPGVSAPNACGLTVGQACDIAARAGACSEVQHFDLMELSPPHDVDGRTARVAALLFMTFVGAFAERSL